ncbi:ATP-grasp domain-containing protein [Staphylococcus gallinarum]|uniref:ATP-grasp domain-containing protein n=1 Tax=Staphylococcus gallinarum TaxID=1293 RepID=UPI002DBDCF8A|nr:ATP-grasp domain-containing protein [Staphylococcus gallinarum]MEB6242701.1 ATP-grasp domain-containing protein [Staphylococcus gallinarum]MEB6295881.1 ATP-grasp domain-containing protein [Staphylococcus gallinarum]
MKKHLVLIYQNIDIPFIFEEAEALEIRLTLINRPDHQSDHQSVKLPAVQRQISIDIFNEEEAINELKNLNEHDPIDGVMTLFDGAVTFTSLLAEELNLPKSGENSHIHLRDKSAMRNQFSAYDINNPQYKVIDDMSDINIIKSMKYPVVIKPKTGFSSLGVIKASNEQEAKNGIEAVQAINEQTLDYMSLNEGNSFSGIIIEEYIDGPEYVAESFVNDGETSILSIGYKGNPTGPYFEEGIYIAPAQLSQSLKEEIEVQVIRANRALGIVNGPTHTELRVGADKAPYILEVGARIGGSGVSHFIVKESTGINLAKWSLCTAIGEKVKISNINETSKCIAGNYIIPTKGHGEITKFNGIHNVLKQEETKRLLQFLNVGNFVEAYPNFSGYPGFVLTTHKNYEACVNYYKWLQNEISINYK